MLAVIALAVLGQVSSAEETLRKIEDKLGDQSAAQITFTSGYQPATDKPEWNPKWEGTRGEITLSGDSKWRYETWNQSGANREVREVFLSNGVTAFRQALVYLDGVYERRANREFPLSQRVAPKDARRAIGRALLRAGNAGASNVVHLLMEDANATAPPVDKWYVLSEVSHSSGESGLNAISYRLTADLGGNGGRYKQDVKIWYDSKTLLLAKRWCRLVKDDIKDSTSLSSWETYCCEVLDSKVPESKFEPVKVE